MFMNQVMHTPVAEVTPMQTAEVWTPADQAMFQEYAGSAAIANEVQTPVVREAELSATEDLARQQAAAIAASQTHRVTSGKVVGIARVTQPGLQLTSIDKDAYVHQQQTQFTEAQRADDNARRAASNKRGKGEAEDELASEEDEFDAVAL
jgi:hypothetical protein